MGGPVRMGPGVLLGYGRGWHVVYMFVLCTGALWLHSHSKELASEGCGLTMLLPLHPLPQAPCHPPPAPCTYPHTVLPAPSAHTSFITTPSPSLHTPPTPPTLTQLRAPRAQRRPQVRSQRNFRLPGQPGLLGGSRVSRRALRMFLRNAPRWPPCERICAQAGDIFMCLHVLACALHKGVMWQVCVQPDVWGSPHGLCQVTPSTPDMCRR